VSAWKPRFAGFVRQADVVGALQQARAQDGMYFHGGTDDGGGGLVYSESWDDGGAGHFSSLATCFGIGCDGRGCLFVMNLKPFNHGVHGGARGESWLTKVS